MIRIISLTDDLSKDWSRFVEAQPEAMPYHSLDWIRLLERTYGYEPAHLMAVRDEQIVGILPALSLRGLRGSRRMVTLPFSHHVPPLAEDPDVRVALTSALLEKARIDRHGSACVHAPVHEIAHPDFHGVTRNLVSILDLANFRSNDRPWDASTRRNLKRARTAGLDIQRAYDEKDFVAFYDLLLKTRRRQGSPVYPRSFVMGLSKLPNARLYVAVKDETPLAGVLILVQGSKAVYAYGASGDDQAVLQLRPNDLLFATVIQILAAEGIKSLDFGTTPSWNANLIRFKEKWGCKSDPLEYSYWFADGSIPRPEDIRMSVVGRLASSLIKKLPLSVLGWISERSFRYLG